MLVFCTSLSLMEFQFKYLTLLLLLSVIDSFGWSWIGNLHKNIQLMLDFFKDTSLALQFYYYTLMTFLMMFSVILLSMLTILSTINLIGRLICDNNYTGFWTWMWSSRHCGLGQWTVWWFQCCKKTKLLSFRRSNNTGSVDVKIKGSLPEEKLYFKILGLKFSSKLDWGSYIISIVETAFPSKKLESWFVL